MRMFTVLQCSAVILVGAHLCMSQEVAVPGPPTTIQTIPGEGHGKDQVPPTQVPPGLATSGTTAQEILSKIPLLPGPIRHAVVVQVPPRYATSSTTATPATAGHRMAPAAGSVSAASGTATTAAVAVTTAVVSDAAGPQVVANGTTHMLPAGPHAESVTQPAGAAAGAGSGGAAHVMDAISSTYQAMLERHNYYRSWHGAAPLTWNAALANDAAGWAGQCYWGHDDSSLGIEGENIWMINDASNPASWGVTAVDDWYNKEVGLYDFNNPGFSMDTGHFSQMVWLATTDLGCAAVPCSFGSFIVCRYSPPGNVYGQFAANVLPRQSNPTTTPPPAPRPSPTPSLPNSPPPSPPTPSPPPTSIPEGVIPENHYLRSPNCLVAPNKAYWMCIHDDGNLVLYNSFGQPIWSSNSGDRSSAAPMNLIMQLSGDLMIVDSQGTIIWHTNTAGKGAAPRRFQVQDDGNALIADANNRATWATYTARA